MQFLIISIVCSVAVSILFKLARKYRIQIIQAVAVNYVVAIACTLYFLKPNLGNWSQYGHHWLLFALLGILFPLGFVVLGKAIERVGMVKTDAAQRLSVFLSILAAFLIFHEVLTLSKMISIVLAFMALVCLLYHPGQSSKKAAGQSLGQTVFWLLLVLVCYGSVDIILKILAKSGQAFSSVLCVAFILSALFIFTYLLLKRTVWQAVSILAGLILGSLNFINILFYIKAHQAYSQHPALVFAGMNLGVITLATLLGTGIFREKINAVNIVGIILALVALTGLFYGADIQLWLSRR
ncbi:DMT family transporter [Neisseriaceae bacterium ESL0693]|nr:DMT family transporter [Neisseriaceae bacterium ESL0693]